MESIVAFDKNTLPPLEIITLTPIEKKEEEKKKPSFLLSHIIEIPDEEKKNKTFFGPYVRIEKIKIDQAVLNYWSIGGYESYKDMIFFIENNQVKRHFLSECPYAGCQFRSRCKTDLKDHLNTIHIHYACHICTICRKGYTSIKGLSRHNRETHKIKK